MPLFHRFFLLLLLACSLAFGGCPSPQQTVKPVDTVVVAPPLVQLSADAVHSPAGDMTVKIRRLRRLAEDGPHLVGGQARGNVRAAYDASGLKGLAEISFQRRWKGSQSRARMEGLVEEFELGKRRFAAYSYTTDGGATLTRVAVFFTATRLYECAIANLTFSDNDPADPKAMEEILRLVLASAMW
ncbi:MAG: hypothetical protein DYG96_16475 [Chlorobi bacterium CHB2]|nr:hypothetical protein [Chlorobi bacterium CHB2]